jgi:hypothetical protein
MMVTTRKDKLGRNPPVPDDTRAARHESQEPPPLCPNCGAAMFGPFCSQCGQRNVNLSVSLRTLASDFADEYLSLDSRLFRSIFALFFRPGYLTRQYLLGRRERFVRPLRLYLVSSLLFFFAIPLLVRAPQMRAPGQESVPVRELVGQIEQQDGAESEEGLQAPAAGWGAQLGVDTLRLGWWSISLQERQERLGGMSLQALLGTARAGFERYLPRMMFVLLPVFALLLKMLYLRRRWYYAEHFIFTLHVHALAFTALLLLLLLPTGPWTGLLLLWCAVYLLVAMYRVYRQSFWKTCLNYLVLTGSYSFLLTVAVAGSIALSLLLV